MARAAVHVEGLDELRKELRRVKDRELDDEMRQIHEDLAKDVLRLAAPNVPVRTGALLQSMRAAGTVRDAIVRVGSASVPYAAAIHWGHPARGIPPRPFLQNAAQRLEANIVDKYDREVAGMLDKVIGR